MLSRFFPRITLALALIFMSSSIHSSAAFLQSNPLDLPQVGEHDLKILSPTLLELTLITTKEPDPARPTQWNFVTDKFQLNAPPAQQFLVLVDSKPAQVKRVGFKRRVLYAPLKRRDLRLGNHLYLELEKPIADGQIVEVQNPSRRLWSTNTQFQADANPMRFSPVIHVNQVGYIPGHPKKAMAGYYLGSLGELPFPDQPLSFQLLDAKSGQPVFKAQLSLRPDVGFTFRSYQSVWEADFSRFNTPGEYRLFIPGLGVSFPFQINPHIAGAFARAYALGLFHQRCGAPNHLPFTRFTHDPCHTNSVDVPTKSSDATAKFLADSASDARNEPRHSAPPLTNISSSLFPFVRQGKLDVSGGHHDAGDYSKYTINSASLIHALVLAADSFPGAGDLDNLGLPESGDGHGDLLQIAKWEADFLAKMQDSDGGFYFLVYPRERRYEDDVPPDRGDPQVVWPKNTSATAAAVAALAQTASSPKFKALYPQAAQNYLDRALQGWTFLDRALKKFGPDGAYQKLTHYGHEFLHHDEIAWAATELFLATQDEKFHSHLIKSFNPADRQTHRWTWWRLYEAYGNAIRSYAFAATSGRIPSNRLQPDYLAKCQQEILGTAEDQLRFARESAYGTSFPDPTKRFRTAGWYFSTDRAFDLITALQLPQAAPRKADFLEAFLSNLNYEAGCNPVNVSYITGLGWKRPRDIVHQHAQNDRRILPPSGLPIGNIQAGFQFLHHYQKELGTLSFPPDGIETDPYPFYDRWGDSFNVSTEFVIGNQGRSLAGTAYLMAASPLKKQSWKPIPARISAIPSSTLLNQSFLVHLEADGLDLRSAQIVWEASGHEPAFGQKFKFTCFEPGPQWIEAEALLPDGRRIFATSEFTVDP